MVGRDARKGKGISLDAIVQGNRVGWLLTAASQTRASDRATCAGQSGCPVQETDQDPSRGHVQQTNEEFDERRRNSDEESRAADPDNGNFFIDKVVCVKVDAAGNQWSTSRLPVSTMVLSLDALTSPCTITIPPITTTTNDSQSVSQRTIEWTLAGPHTRG